MGRPFISIPGVEVLDELGRGAHSAVFRVRRAGRYYATKIPQRDGEASPPVRHHVSRHRCPPSRAIANAPQSTLRLANIGSVSHLFRCIACWLSSMVDRLSATLIADGQPRTPVRHAPASSRCGGRRAAARRACDEPTDQCSLPPHLGPNPPRCRTVTGRAEGARQSGPPCDPRYGVVGCSAPWLFAKPSCGSGT